MSIGSPARSTARSGRTSAPRLLLVSAHRWLHTAQVALAARNAGFAVDLLAPAGHPIAELNWVRAVGRYSAMRPHGSVIRALNTYDPTLILPVDDLGALAVFRAYADRSLKPAAARIITQSLGDADSFELRHRRTVIGEIARASGATAPPSWPFAEPDRLPDIIAESGLPAVIKADGSFGGQGVITVDDLAQARAAYAQLSRPPRILSSVGRLVFDDEANYIAPSLRRRRPEISVQSFLPGHPATLTAACWKGEVLGHIAVHAIQTRGPSGPATVVEPIDNADMVHTAHVLAQALGLSGIFGVDFIVAPDGETAALLELNPRATPTAHLHLPSSRPLFELLAQQLGVAPTQPARSPLPNGPVALFPQESLRDPASPYLTSAHHDIPDEAPDVVELCRRWAARPLMSVPARVARLVRAYKRRDAGAAAG